MKAFLVRILQGIAIGVCAILPGVSGGVMAVTMGLYEDMVHRVRTLFQKLKDNFFYLLPIAIGGVIGALFASNTLKTFFDGHSAQVTILFCGFVLGNLPWLFLEAKGEARFKRRYVAAFFAGLAFILVIAYFESLVSANEPVAFLTPLKALLAGAVLSVGIIIPGVSASFLLLYMGTYSAILTAIAHVELRTLFFAGLGFIAMSAVLIGLVERMLKRHHALSYFAIIGFSTGSVAIVLPSVIEKLTWICPFLFVVGLTVSVLMGYFKARKLGMELPPELLFSNETKNKPE